MSCGHQNSPQEKNFDRRTDETIVYAIAIYSSTHSAFCRPVGTRKTRETFPRLPAGTSVRALVGTRIQHAYFLEDNINNDNFFFHHSQVAKQSRSIPPDRATR